MTISSLPAIYHATTTWEVRLSTWHVSQEPFAQANATAYSDLLSDRQAGPRMVVNVGGFSLEKLLSSGTHLNCYQLARIGGGTNGPSARRVKVDGWISSTGLQPNNIHFGAVALESSGVRFYGEYCLVLKTVPDNTQILDRDSYELDCEPLSAHPVLSVFNILRGTWGRDLKAMAIFRARDVLRDSDRAVTEGRLADSLLRGQEFIEVHQSGGFGPSDLAEVRIPASDIACQRRILDAVANGVAPSPQELVWLARRARLDRALALARIRVRVVDAPIVR